MLVLALDSSADLLSLALLEDDDVVAERARRARRPTGEGLLPSATALLAEAGVTLADVELIAVATGPGSFNGIRGGVATAVGLAMGRGIAAVGVPTLEAAAYQQVGRAPVILALLPAGRGEYYAAAFSGEGTEWRRLGDQRVGALGQVVAGLPAGSMMSRRLSDEENSAVLAAGLRLPPFGEGARAAVVGLLGARRFAQPGFDVAASLRPVYLRAPGITRAGRVPGAGTAEDAPGAAGNTPGTETV